MGNTKSDLGRAVVHLEDGFDYEEESKIADELTNTAAGALMLEFGILSRLTDDQKYEVSLINNCRMKQKLRHLQCGTCGLRSAF